MERFLYKLVFVLFFVAAHCYAYCEKWNQACYYLLMALVIMQFTPKQSLFTHNHFKDCTVFLPAEEKKDINEK